jgi:threonine/homoserine/homoserine lactone efflux protein
MQTASLLLFAGALIVAAGSPGPSIAALISRVIACGWRDVLPFVAAMWIGEAIWLSCAIAGLAGLTQTYYAAFVVLKYAGVVYLLFLGWQMWHIDADSQVGITIENGHSPSRMFLTGMAVTLGNPKIMVFYLALLPNILDMRDISFFGWIEMTATMFLVLALIDIGYIVLAAKMRLLLKNSRVVRLVNRISATIMGSAAIFIATR